MNGYTKWERRLLKVGFFSMTGLAVTAMFHWFRGRGGWPPCRSPRWSRGLGRGRGHWGRNRHYPPDHGQAGPALLVSVTGLVLPDMVEPDAEIRGPGRIPDLFSEHHHHGDAGLSMAAGCWASGVSLFREKVRAKWPA